jgi:putative nucleotidyltransferase with HDIG domain
MRPAALHVSAPEPIEEFVRGAHLHAALTALARLADAELVIAETHAEIPAETFTAKPGRSESATPNLQSGTSNSESERTLASEAVNLRSAPAASVWPIVYRGKPAGRVLGRPEPVSVAAAAAGGSLARVFEHMLDRELAVRDLAREMTTNYEELNLLYGLLPTIATGVHESAIGKLLVDETARTLACRRVSLLVLDESGRNLRLLAACGVPDEAFDLTIPISRSIAGQALIDEDLLVIDDIARRPDLLELSRGRYETASFAVARVPLRARGEALGILTATERIESADFTARDRKLLDALSAMGASALLNCRLRAALDKQLMSAIRALASAVDAKDHYTHDHSARVAELSVATARQLGITDDAAIREVELAAVLHDIGKIGIPDAVLAKVERLTAEEFTLVKNHVNIGARIVHQVPGLERVATAILHHHERFDGLGYPSGLSGDAIPVAARIITVADVFDCLTSERPYRKGISRPEALNEIEKCRGTQLDPAVVDAFRAVIAQESRQRARPGPGASTSVEGSRPVPARR